MVVPNQHQHHHNHYGGDDNRSRPSSMVAAIAATGAAATTTATTAAAATTKSSIGTKRSRRPPGSRTTFVTHGIGHKQRVEEYIELEHASKAAIAAIKAENTAMYDALAGLLSVAEAEAEKERIALDALAAIGNGGGGGGGNSSSRAATTMTGSEGMMGIVHDADHMNRGNKIEESNEQQQQQQQEEEIELHNKNSGLPGIDNTNKIVQDMSCDNDDETDRPLKRAVTAPFVAS